MEVQALLVAFHRRNGVKEMLLLHSDHKHYLMLPGGTLHAHETAEAALERHLAEQLTAPASKITAIGRINSHTTDGRLIHIYLFTGEFEDLVHTHMHGGRIEWMDKSRAHMHAGRLPTMIFDKIFSHLETLGLW